MTDEITLYACCHQLTEDSATKPVVSGDVDKVSSAVVRRSKDLAECRVRGPRVKCKPPRSMYLGGSDLMSAVSTQSGSAHGETLVKMTESQLHTLRRQVNYHFI